MVRTIDVGTDGRHGAVQLGGCRFGRFFARYGNDCAVGNLCQKCFDVGGLDYLQKFIGSIVLQPSHGGGGVVHGNARGGTKGGDFVVVESLGMWQHKVILVAEKE